MVKKTATSLRLFKTKMLFQLALCRREAKSLKSQFEILFYYLMIHIVKPIILFRESTNPLKYFFLIFLPLIYFLVLAASLLLGIVAYIIVGLRSIKLGFRKWIPYLASYGFWAIVYRSGIAILTVGVTAFIGLLLGHTFNTILIFHQYYTDYGWISQLVFVIAGASVSLLFIMMFSSLKKECGSLREVFRGLEELSIAYERGELRDSFKDAGKVYNVMIKYLSRPFFFMLTLCFIAQTEFMILIYTTTILSLRFPGLLISYQGMNDLHNISLGSMFYVMQKALDVIPFSIFKSFITFEYQVVTLKPWGSVWEFVVQAISLINLVLVSIAALYYVNYWRKKRDRLRKAA